MLQVVFPQNYTPHDTKPCVASKKSYPMVSLLRDIPSHCLCGLAR